MGLKQFYYKMEDKFYDFVEKHNLQKITDRIDKVMPSFVLFLIICVLLLTGLIYLVVALVSGPSAYGVYFKVVDGDSGILLTDVPLQITSEDGINTYLTESEGLTDKILVPKNTEIFVDVDFSNQGYSRFSESYLIEEDDQTITIALSYIGNNSNNFTTKYSFNLVDPNGALVNASGVVSFTCAGGVGQAPNAVNVYSGQVDVTADSLCNLRATISMNGYQTKYDVPVVNGSNISLLQETGGFEGEYGNFTAYVKNASGENLSNIKVTLKNDFGLLIDSCVTGTNGSCTISEIEKGFYYTINITDNRTSPIYSSVVNDTMLIDQDNVTKTYTLSSEVSGVIKIKVYDEDNQTMEDTLVSLKTEDSLLDEKYTDSSGLVTFNVSNLDLDYRAVVDVEGYFIASKVVVPDEDPLNTTIQTIYLDLVTPNSIKPLNVSVVDVSGNAYKFAKVVLFDANTGYMTDYAAQTTNYNGEAIFNVRSGDYFAVAVKGSSRAQSDVFTFDVRLAETYDPVVILMIPNKGYLNVKAVDKEGNPIANVKVDVYDRFSYMNEDDELQVIKSDLSDPNGEIFFEVDADSDYYVVISDPINDVYGKTQSRFVRVTPEVTKDLEVVLYRNVSSSSKPELIFHGLYKGDSVATGNLSAGEEYEAKFTLLMPNREDSDFEEYEEAGFIFRVGKNNYLENDSLYIKYIDIPNAESITKYTQYDNDMTEPYEVDGVYDVDTRTYEDAKWAKVVFSDDVSDEFYNAYELNAIVKVKDTAVVGQELKVYNLGYGLTDDGYETFFEYTGNQEDVSYFDVYSSEIYGVGDEILCGDYFCFSSTIVDIEDDLRYNITDSFSSMPNKNYKYHFMLVNNDDETRYINSRLLIENNDEGLTFENISVSEPNGNVYNITANPNDFSYEFAISSLGPKQKVEGDIYFTTSLVGNRMLDLLFISDQEIKFLNQLNVDVSSENEFEVTAYPNILPAYEPISLRLEVNDATNGVRVDSSYDATVTVKDMYNNVLVTKDITESGEIFISSEDFANYSLEAGDVIKVYVSAPEFETYELEVRATDKLFAVTPKKLAYSLNIHNEKAKVETFEISNLSEMDLEVSSIELLGSRLDYIDLDKINADLASYEGLVISGLDTESTFPNNEDATKEISVNITLNPRAETITEVANLEARLNVVLKSTITESSWVYEVPVKVNIAFDGLLDNPDCLTLTKDSWLEVSQNKAVEDQFLIKNECTMNSKTVPLLGGLEAKVEFDSAPLGTFTLNVDNSVVELSQGYYKKVLDAMDRDSGYPVTLKYEPEGRMVGEVSGRIIFRSINNTSSGEQELISEFPFTIDVLNLKDCYTLSKDVLTLNGAPDSFTIENVGCGAATSYRLSCDDCRGLDIEPMQNIVVEETGTSREIIVTSYDAVPGQYNMNLYSKIDNERGTEKNVGVVKVIVRPENTCLDLDRYEFDLFRAETSENSGDLVRAKSYDTANLINLCYTQEISGRSEVAQDAAYKLALIAGLRDGVYGWATSGFIKLLSDANISSFKEAFITGVDNPNNNLKDDDTTDNDTTDNDTKDNDTKDNDSTNDGTTDNDSTNDGTTNDGTTKDASTSDQTKTFCNDNGICEAPLENETNCIDCRNYAPNALTNPTVEQNCNNNGICEAPLETVANCADCQQTDDGATDEGTTDDGQQTDEGTTDDGQQTDEGTTDEGTTDEGTTDEGTTDEGTTDEGTTDEGTTDEGTTDEGTTDEGTTDDGQQTPEPTVIDSTYLTGLDKYNGDSYTGLSAPAKTLFTNLARYANELAGITKYNYAQANNSDICGKNNCSEWINIDQVIPGQIIGYTSPNSAGSLGYFVIYLGKDNQGIPKVFRLSGTRQKILIETFNETYGASYNLKKVITNKK